MPLFPSEIVVIVHRVDDSATDNTRHPVADPIAPRTGVCARQFHTRPILLPQLAIEVEKHRRHVHAVLATAGLYKMRRQLMPKTTRTKMHAEPHLVLTIDKNIHIVIARPHRAQLRLRQFFEVARYRNFVPYSRCK